jgi:hypothetical protein
MLCEGYCKVCGHTVEIMWQVAGDLARTSRGGFSKNRRFFKP